MDFLKQIGMSLLGGWIIGIVFGWLKLPALCSSVTWIDWSGWRAAGWLLRLT